MKDLPRFRRRDYDEVRAYAAQMLTNHEAPQTALLRLTEREDHSFQAVFAKRYFVLAEGETEPTRSQWNNLKKRFKRTEPNVFLFKDHGVTTCPDGSRDCYFLEFGFYLHRDLPGTTGPAARPARMQRPEGERRPRPAPRRRSDR